MGSSEGVQPGLREQTNQIVSDQLNQSENWLALPRVEKDLLEMYNRSGNKGEPLMGAKFNKVTSQAVSSTGADVTQLYNKYITWQQKQRESRADHARYVLEAEATPGRKQTILTNGGPGSVLGDVQQYGKTVLG